MILECGGKRSAPPLSIDQSKAKRRRRFALPAHSKIRKMQVLIADKFEQSGRAGLQAIGCEVSFQPDLKDDALVEAIGTAKPDVLVVRGTKVTELMLAAGPLKLIVRAGAGYNTIDVAAAS